MKPGIELDALVAEKVMELKNVTKLTEPGFNEYFGASQGDYIYSSGYIVPKYSTDIAAAWDVMEKLASFGFEVTIIKDNSSYIRCIIKMEEDSMIFPALAASHAICLAALKVIAMMREDAKIK